MNIFFRELKSNRKSLVLWSIGMFFMIAAGMGKYSGYAAGAQSMNKLIEDMPEAVKLIININYFDLSKASGFYGVLFPYILIIAAVHSAMLGVNIISKEERDKTAEFLLVKPVKRDKVITSKLMAALLNILILNCTAYISSLLIVQYYSNGEKTGRDILLLMAGMLVVQLIFVLAGALAAVVCKRANTAPSVIMGVLLMLFVISKIIDINSKLDILKYITPFKYFEPQKLMYGGGLDPVYLIISFILVVTMLYIIYIMYRKKDINI